MTFCSGVLGAAVNFGALFPVASLAPGKVRAGSCWRHRILSKVFFHPEMNRQNDRYYGNGAQYQHQEKNLDDHRVTG